MKQIVATILFCLLTVTSYGQKFALRNNLLYDATLTPNLGIEIGTDSAWSVGVNAGLNAWDLDKQKNKKWRHVLVSPYVRHYFGHRADTVRYHLGVDTTHVKAEWRDTTVLRRLRYLEANLIYSYGWIMSRDWRIEAEAGIAVGYAWFKEYECPRCGQFLGDNSRIFLLPQLGINVVYIIN